VHDPKSKNGCVTPAQKDKAENIAQAANGVAKIDNQLQTC
jgi:osmotically-inducible protein OsmY